MRGGLRLPVRMKARNQLPLTGTVQSILSKRDLNTFEWPSEARCAYWALALAACFSTREEKKSEKPNLHRAESHDFLNITCCSVTDLHASIALIAFLPSITGRPNLRKNERER